TDRREERSDRLREEAEVLEPRERAETQDEAQPERAAAARGVRRVVRRVGDEARDRVVDRGAAPEDRQVTPVPPRIKEDARDQEQAVLPPRAPRPQPVQREDQREEEE